MEQLISGPAKCVGDRRIIGARLVRSASLATNGATFYITGVKLEIGSVATPFNRQSLAKSWADCQRYYQVGNVQSSIRLWVEWVGTFAGSTTLSSYDASAVPTTTSNFTVQTNRSASAMSH